MATLSSLASIVPLPSESNKSKASLISCFCSSVRFVAAEVVPLQDAGLVLVIRLLYLHDG
jgi:hypothetical protein